jgi:hypothetical protein
MDEAKHLSKACTSAMNNCGVKIIASEFSEKGTNANDITTGAIESSPKKDRQVIK